MNKIIQGDTLAVLKTLSSESVDCIVSSPPYYGLRDYGVEGQVGLEKSLTEYLERMLLITAELKRVLKKTGTMWWNHGDSYAGSGKGWGDEEPDPKFKSVLRGGGTARSRTLRPERSDIPAKSLMMQAHRLAIRMVDEQGWILRNQIIWHKPNVMPSSVKDRFTVDYEPILFFTKSKRYWFEQQFEDSISGVSGKFNVRVRDANIGKSHQYKASAKEIEKYQGETLTDGNGQRGKRSVWKISTKPYSEAHFATFPSELIETPIKAGCPQFVCLKCGKPREKIIVNGELVLTGHSRPAIGKYKETSDKTVGGKMFYRDKKAMVPDAFFPKINKGYTDCGCKVGFTGGVCLDPFMGSGTTALVARSLGRNYLGIELNPEYIKLAEKRLKQQVLI